MFKELENRIKITKTAFSLLNVTWEAMLNSLEHSRILLLVYYEIPPIFEQSILDSLQEIAVAKGLGVERDLHRTPTQQQTIFLVSSRQSKVLTKTLRLVTKHIVESQDNARFIIVLSREQFVNLVKHNCYPLVKEYIYEINEISQDPLPFLCRLTGLESVTPYTERNLWRLMLYAAVIALEEKEIEQELVQDLISGVQLIECDDIRICFYEWDSLPIVSNLSSLYFESMHFSEAQQEVARRDETYYLARSFIHFHGFADAHDPIRKSKYLTEKFDLLLRIKTETSAQETIVEALGFWQRLAWRYLLAEKDPPRQNIGPVDPSLLDNPSLRNAVDQLAEHLGSPSPFSDFESLKKATRIAYEHLSILIAGQNVNLIHLEDLLDNYLSEFRRRLSDYDNEEVKQLLAKTIAIANDLYSLLSLQGDSLSDKSFGILKQLWSDCISVLDDTVVFNGEHHKITWEHIRILESFEPRFQGSRDLLVRAEESTRIELKVKKIIEAENPIKSFTKWFAQVLKDHDYFLDLGYWRPVAIQVAKLYVDFDKMLITQNRSFYKQDIENRNLENLVKKAHHQNKFERIFILLIDSLSYLEWVLIRQFVESIAQENIEIIDDYAYAPIPTITPANTTSLITGFHPSEIGVCDWKIKPAGKKICDIKEDSAVQEIVKIGKLLKPKNKLTLVHNQSGSNLTMLWNNLAETDEVVLQGSGSSIRQIQNELYQLSPSEKITVVYISDFDHAGHWHLSLDGWDEYYSLLGKRIKENLLQPIFRRAKKEAERTSVLLTSDHGKLSRYESNLLKLVVPRTITLKDCEAVLEDFEFSRSSRHIVAWIPGDRLTDVTMEVQKLSENDINVVVFSGNEVQRFFRYTSRTHLQNPNLLILSRFGISGSNAMGHGGGSVSEVIVPSVTFSWR